MFDNLHLNMFDNQRSYIHLKERDILSLSNFPSTEWNIRHRLVL